jgi:membrane protease YdiL (CAAX protease family)
MKYIEHYPISEAIAVVLIIGVLFSFMAHISTRTAIKLTESKPVQRREILVLISLIIYITIVLSFGIDQIKSSFSQLYLDNSRAKEIITITYKLLLFFIVPFLVYKCLYKFNIYDFGLHVKLKEFFTKKNLMIMATMAVTILLFQYFLGNGARPVREGVFTSKQLIIGLPLFYVWLIFDVGLVEEFFFRAVLQSRLAAVTKSELGGIILSGLLFGLAHAPGFYQRGSGILDNLGTNPSLFLSIGYSIIVLSVPGFFLGVIWSRTRNLWLVMAVHAFVDLLPGLSEFINIWNIH